MWVEVLPRFRGAATAWPVTLMGDRPLRDRLPVQAQGLGVTDQLQCLGFCSDPQRFLAEAAVFVLPSRFEGIPNVLLESIAAGLVVPSDHPIALAAEMTPLASDSDRCKRMGDAARARIASLDWPRLEPLWRSVLGLS